MYLGIQHRVFASIRTVIVFTIIILVLLWIHFTTPIPPYPEGGGGPGMGLEVNLGTSEEGMGKDQSLEPVEMPDFKATPVVPAEAEKILTQDEEVTGDVESAEKTEPAEVIHKIKSTKKIKNKNIHHKNTTEDNIQPKLNPKALFKPKNGTSNEGTTGKLGDQGNPNGIAGSPLYKGNGSGEGGGTGGGSGKGTGTGIGDGISFDLKNREKLFLQPPEYNYQAEGVVVVKITVDKNGDVINAVTGVKGSTTLDDYLLQVARKAALQSKFSRKPDAPIQTGTIRYHFLLQSR
jgi:TonB family protein